MKTPATSYHKGQHEDKHFRAQMKKVFEAFKRQPATMLMVSVETGILRANICRYVAKWKREGIISYVKQDIYPISKYCTEPLTKNIEPSKAGSHEQ